MRLHRTKERLSIKVRIFRYELEGYASRRQGLPDKVFYHLRISKLFTNPELSANFLLLDKPPIVVSGFIRRGGGQRWKFSQKYLTSQEARQVLKSLNDFAEDCIEV